MNTNLAVFKALKVYGNLPLTHLLKLMFCNRIMNSSMVLGNTGGLYRVGRFFPGKLVTDWIIDSTFGKVFSGGKTIEEMNTFMENPKMHCNITVYIDFPTMISYVGAGRKQEWNS